MRLPHLRTLVSVHPTRPAWADARVACVWLPQLPLRIEVLRRPALEGRPLVLGGGPGERKVVQLCSPEAERAGIRPGLPLREVVPLCREAVVLQSDPVRVATLLEEVLAKLQRVSPLVELAPEEGCFFLDLRGLKGVYGTLAALADAIQAAVPPPLRPRLGLAGGKFAAAVAARLAGDRRWTTDYRADAAGLGDRSSTVGGPPDAVVVPAGATRAFLAPLPIVHLPFAPEVLERLELLGLRTIGDLARLPFAAVQSQLGPAGARAWRLANGQDDEPLVPRGHRPSVQASLRLDDPIASVDGLLAALNSLLAEAFVQVADGRGLSVRQLRLRALLADGTSWERLYTFKEALSSREAALRALRSKLELPNGFPPAAVEELSLELVGLGGEAAKQPSLFSAPARQVGQVAEAARQLRARYGRVPLYRVVEVEPWSRIPERRWALVTCEL